MKIILIKKEKCIYREEYAALPILLTSEMKGPSDRFLGIRCTIVSATSSQLSARHVDLLLLA